MDELDDLDDYSYRYSENDPISKYWPMKDSPPRKTQVDALDWISKLPANKKYILCELPVGTGKSSFAINYAGWLSKSTMTPSSFVLTPQKILQKQYEDSFDSRLIGSLMGKGNYECKSKNTNCDIGGDIKPECSNCPAKDAKERALHSPNMVLNYTLALLLFKYADKRKFPPRKLMIFDECHTLENHLTEFNAVAITEFRCKKINVNYYSHKKMREALEWIESEYYNAIAKKLSEYVRITDEINSEIEFNPRKLTKDEQSAFKNAKEFEEHMDALDFILGFTHEELNERFVLVNEGKSFRFKELYGKNVFHSLVKPMADKFLFMSSTILNKDGYCRDLGIDPDEAAFISLPSEFPIENRPVVFTPVCKVNYEFFEDKNYSDRQNMVVKIKEITDQHHDESGIIHTSSFKMSEWLVEELSTIVKHDILHHNPSLKGVTRDQVIDEYMRVAKTTPTILVSPSITEGLDLVEDLARWSVIMKLNYPNMQDAWIKRRMELSKEWYNRLTMLSVIQAAGRIVRSKDDWGVTYVTDSSFNYLYYQMYKQIPEWWHEGLIKL